MIIIECPHCGEHIQMDEQASGLFDCPHCSEEFEFGESSIPDATKELTISGVNNVVKLGIGSVFASLLLLLLGLVFLNGAMNGFSDSVDSTECDDDIWIDSLTEPPNCDSEGNWGIGSLVFGIVLILMAIGAGVIAFISFTMEFNK